MREDEMNVSEMMPLKTLPCMNVLVKCLVYFAVILGINFSY